METDACFLGLEIFSSISQKSSQLHCEAMRVGSWTVLSSDPHRVFYDRGGDNLFPGMEPKNTLCLHTQNPPNNTYLHLQKEKTYVTVVVTWPHSYLTLQNAMHLPGGGMGKPFCGSDRACSKTRASWADPSQPDNMYVNFKSKSQAAKTFHVVSPLRPLNLSALAPPTHAETWVPSIAPTQP